MPKRNSEVCPHLLHICVIFVLLVKLKVLGFVAALLCLVHVAVIGRFNKLHPLNHLKDMISGKMKKFGNSPLLFDMIPGSSPFRMALID